MKLVVQREPGSFCIKLSKHFAFALHEKEIALNLFNFVMHSRRQP